MTTPAPPTRTLAERRREFVAHLHSLHSGLSSPNPRRVAECRQVLARLRRTFAGPRQQAEAYEVVFAHDPPESEQEVWLLVAGLFALHPQPRRRSREARSLGSSMGTLEQLRGSSTGRRFTQLLVVDKPALHHYLRQTIRLLVTENVPVDYDQLLDDLIVLLSDRYREDEAHRVRLRWARDYHRRPAARPTEDSEQTSPTP
jgi:CRISPR system Cascade subunit CasB